MNYKRIIQIVLLMAVLVLSTYLFKQADTYTSSAAFCNSCHVHNHAQLSWEGSTHYIESEEELSCVSCHLPPKGEGFYREKIKRGFKDVYAYYFKDSVDHNWELKSRPEQAREHTFKASCLECHPKLFPIQLSPNGEIAHWHYQQHETDMHCIDCHLNVGHGPGGKASHNFELLNTTIKTDTLYLVSAQIRDLKSFTETIPQSSIGFDMIAIEKGDSSFFIGKAEVSWDEYLLFLRETESEGRSENEIDGFSGATPPWGNPDQGWGMGSRPAITMTHHAASMYCKWLSVRTGKSYRLPTEAEWEYVARQVITTESELVNTINSDKTKTIEPQEVSPDVLGLHHLFGNVKEFCADEFEKGSKEHVLKGGSFKSEKTNYRADYREATQHDHWMKTDPQIPKSIWWYSDCNDVGFRLVLTYQNTEKP
ncbi:NapC/NirT family cytochrome c [Carboxylicivirga sp. N1Y90]|uniref:NapC/NirT family cytochrome c n=1 Tax=Carboxylicivirga fragile TaxID=3417571 RepID=UPI003D34AA41